MLNKAIQEKDFLESGVFSEKKKERFKPWMKIISIFVIFCFVYQNIVSAAGAPPLASTLNLNYTPIATPSPENPLFSNMIFGGRVYAGNYGGSHPRSGTWASSSGDYRGGNYSVPAGYSTPQIPSYTNNAITPTYYFSVDLNVNNAGFTNPSSGEFVNPAGMSFVPSSVAKNPTGTMPVFFHNGLDGVGFKATDQKLISQIDSTYVQGLGLDKVVDTGETDTVWRQESDGSFTEVDQRPVFQTSTGFRVNHLTYQNVAFINENLSNMTSNDPSRVSTDNSKRDPSVVVPGDYGAYNTSSGEVAMTINEPGQYISWNYQSGAYMKPGDTVRGSGNQYLAGIGTSGQNQSLGLYSHKETNTYQGTVGNVNGGVGIIPQTGSWDISAADTVTINNGATTIEGDTLAVVENVPDAKYSSDGLALTHKSYSYTFGDRKRTVSSDQGFISRFIDEGSSWSSNWADTGVFRTENLRTNEIEQESKVSFKPGEKNTGEGWTREISYNSMPVASDFSGANSNQNSNQDLPQQSVSEGIKSRWATSQIAPYNYLSRSTNGEQHAFNLPFLLDTSRQGINFSPMFQGDHRGKVEHTFSGDINKLVSGIQLDRNQNITGEIVAVANYSQATDTLSSLDGMTAVINRQGFVETEGLVSGWQNINASGSYFKDILGKGKVAQDQFSSKGVNFWVQDGGKDFLTFSLNELNIAGNTYNADKGLDFGTEENLTGNHTPYVTINGNNPLILSQSQTGGSSTSISEDRAREILSRDVVRDNLPEDYDLSKDDNYNQLQNAFNKAYAPSESNNTLTENEEGITYAEGIQRANFIVQDLNTPLTVLSGDFRNRRFNVAQLGQSRAVDTTVFLKDQNVAFTKGIYRGKAGNLVDEIVTDYAARVTTENAGIFAGTKEYRISEGTMAA
ncbi:MAG: hypothetical protein K9L61_00575, partial [Candidatus Omnitrophica bacterium]|nr:hypothetical protein [Candidatus Omnitrophota bacterium]